MSKHIHFSGPFIKQFHCKDNASNERKQDNPAAAALYANFVPAPLRRIHLFIQNQGSTEVTISFSDDGVLGSESSMTLYAFQSVSFDNYNGPVIINEPNNVHIMEAFA